MTRFRYVLLSLTFLTQACVPPELPSGAPAPGELSEKEQNMLSIARTTRASGNQTSAIELYQQMINQSPHTAAPYLELASIYREQSKPLEAAQTLENGRKLEPANTRLLSSLGSAYVAAQKPGLGIQVFDEALKLDPNNTSLLNGKGVALDNLGDHTAAQASYRAGLALDPANIPIRNNLALSLTLSDQFDESVQMLEALGSGENSTPTIRQNLALAYGLKGDKEKAMQLGLKDLKPEDAQENLRFYEFYQGRRKAGAPAHAAVPVAPVSAAPFALTPEVKPAEGAGTSGVVKLEPVTPETSKPAETFPAPVVEKNIPASASSPVIESPVAPKPAPVETPTKDEKPVVPEVPAVEAAPETKATEPKATEPKTTETDTVEPKAIEPAPAIEAVPATPATPAKKADEGTLEEQDKTMPRFLMEEYPSEKPATSEGKAGDAPGVTEEEDSLPLPEPEGTLNEDELLPAPEGATPADTIPAEKKLPGDSPQSSVTPAAPVTSESAPAKADAVNTKAPKVEIYEAKEPFAKATEASPAPAAAPATPAPAISAPALQATTPEASPEKSSPTAADALSSQEKARDDAQPSATAQPAAAPAATPQAESKTPAPAPASTEVKKESAPSVNAETASSPKKIPVNVEAQVETKPQGEPVPYVAPKKKPAPTGNKKPEAPLHMKDFDPV